MISEIFDSKRLPVRDQYEGWRAWNTPLLDVTSEMAVDAGFRAENQVWKLVDGLLLTKVTAPAARADRSPRLIRHLPVDHWVVTHLLHGTTSLQTPRGTIEAQAGQSYIWSLGQVSCSKRSRIDRVDMLLSRDTFRDIAPLLDAATGSVLDASLGRLLGDFLRTLLRRLPGLPDDDAPVLTSAIGRLVAACVAPSVERLEPARMFIDVGRLERVRQTVRANLHSPFLGPKMMCRQVGMSRSNLYRLLECEGGVTSYIQRHRLTEARYRLSDSRNTQSIAAMAQDLCFTDSSSFSRAFRAMFSVSPGEVRATSVNPGAPYPAPPARPTRPCTCFGDLLRKH
ncbi:MAG TPA: helix-turn-helix domain-containing protein [Acetobacteraceae bacterium]|nr:helix-turn-helix domain-containing protein [Acetobacteraceae bacterium]